MTGLFRHPLRRDASKLTAPSFSGSGCCVTYDSSWCMRSLSLSGKEPYFPLLLDLERAEYRKYKPCSILVTRSIRFLFDFITYCRLLLFIKFWNSRKWLISISFTFCVHMNLTSNSVYRTASTSAQRSRNVWWKAFRVLRVRNADVSLHRHPWVVHQNNKAERILTRYYWSVP